MDWDREAAARSSEGYIDKKNDRRMDDCLRYALVSGQKARPSARARAAPELVSSSGAVMPHSVADWGARA